MTIMEHDPVVMLRDMPEFGLKACDLGVVIALHPPDGAEVEFTTAAGRTRAVVTLTLQDIRSVSVDDMLTIRAPTPPE